MGTNWNVSYLITVESLTLASYLHVLKSLKLRKQNRGKKKIPKLHCFVVVFWGWQRGEEQGDCCQSEGRKHKNAAPQSPACPCCWRFGWIELGCVRAKTTAWSRLVSGSLAAAEGNQQARRFGLDP